MIYWSHFKILDSYSYSSMERNRFFSLLTNMSNYQEFWGHSRRSLPHYYICRFIIQKGFAIAINHKILVCGQKLRFFQSRKPHTRILWLIAITNRFWIMNWHIKNRVIPKFDEKILDSYSYSSMESTYEDFLNFMVDSYHKSLLDYESTYIIMG